MVGVVVVVVVGVVVVVVGVVVVVVGVVVLVVVERGVVVVGVVVLVDVEVKMLDCVVDEDEIDVAGLVEAGCVNKGTMISG